ncbi:MAG: hypothetical protein U0525_03200 [Patescibacteria group bacterium]
MLKQIAWLTLSTVITMFLSIVVYASCNLFIADLLCSGGRQKGCVVNVQIFAIIIVIVSFLPTIFLLFRFFNYRNNKEA